MPENNLPIGQQNALYLLPVHQPSLKITYGLTCAQHANAMAQRLYKKLSTMPDIKFTQTVESNQLFFIMPREKEDKLQEYYHFYFWNETIGEMRLVTSFDTTEEDVDKLIACIKDSIIISRFSIRQAFRPACSISSPYSKA